MTQFKPTFLCIKEHKITGLLYFGKTTKQPEKYSGSGLYWKRHLMEHGSHISTLWFCLFEDKQELINFALLFSKQENIVESTKWANLKFENGLDGALIGHSCTKGEKNGMFGKHHDAIFKEKVRSARVLNPWTSTGNLGGTSWNKGLTKDTDEKLAKISKNISAAMLGKPSVRKGTTLSEETKHKMRKPKSTTANMKRPKLTRECAFCHSIIAVGAYTRFHGEKCSSLKK